MILIFGGTTEGRIAINVCEQAGKPFYYSTKSNLQQVDMKNGIRLVGAMTSEDIRRFCKENDIKCIVDAAHPFAENLHKAIMNTDMPVVRFDRPRQEKIEGAVYCKSFEEAAEIMKQHDIKLLLALSGVNTIAKLKSYWQTHNTVFRILNRQESIETAKASGLPADHIIFYDESLCLPTEQQEIQLMKSIGCDAIITKESGQSGGFDQKINAAKRLGIKIFIVEPPSTANTQHSTLDSRLSIITGPHSLRRAIEKAVPDFFPLKTGLSTGACATAATKAALLSVLTGDCPKEVVFALPDGESITIPVEVESEGIASVVKDFSDDPDVTRGCKITAKVELNESSEIRFLRGEGVGTVTLPGLGIPVGGPAINATPREMMTNEVRALTDQGCDITISVENGSEIAKNTFNEKVGVTGGISIIGTTGIVSPLSNEAFVESIGRELQVARAIGCTAIGLASGKNGEDALRTMFPDLRVVHYGNFIGEALKKAYAMGFEEVHLGIMIGKAVKLAEGNLDTHSHKVQMNKQFLKSLAPEYADKIDNITMARELWQFMPPAFFDKIQQLCLSHCRTVFPQGELQIHLIK